MSQENARIVENFYGVYLLYCKNPAYLGRVYIGFTIDPNRRIQQHNTGKEAGGAWRTNKRGPWVMVMIIHGFPNQIAAMRFEWAWQHPDISRRLKHVPRKKSREKKYDFCLRVLSEMLRVGPWCRLPLTVRWLSDELSREFPVAKTPPAHMPICYGPVISKKVEKPQEEDDYAILECCICEKAIENKPLRCLKPKCKTASHIICLSRHVLEETGEYIPVEGKCPKCNEKFLWGDLVRKYNGCYGDSDVTINTEEFCHSE